MIARFLVHILPLLLPFMLYGSYIWILKKREKEHPEWREAPWFWLIASGLVLMIASFVIYALVADQPAGTPYQPARIEQGRIVH